MTSALRWGVLAVLWSLFTLWYTNLSGPLSEAEIDAHLARAAEQGRDVAQLARLERFMREDDGSHFVMVNILDLAPEGAEENLGRYMAHMWPALLARACHPVFAGAAIAPAMDLAGVSEAAGGAAVWDQGALMRYRSRRDLLEIALDPAFLEPHHYKIEALTKTIAFPVAPSLNPGDPRLLLALVLLVLGLGADRFLPARFSPRR
ncbi:MAG: hypothetical protein V2J24_22960 [Pseudomonadales bacterium]|nr:hypothetical protein [Pseudomonadales bacterium]